MAGSPGSPAEVQELYTLPDAARLLGLDSSVLRRALQSGHLVATRPGREYLFTATQLQAAGQYFQALRAVREASARGSRDG